LEDRPGPAKPPSPSGRVVRTGGVRGGFRGETRTACGGDGEAVQAGRICGIVEGGGVVWGAAFSTDPVPPPQGFDCSSSVLPPVGTNCLLRGGRYRKPGSRQDLWDRAERLSEQAGHPFRNRYGELINPKGAGAFERALRQYCWEVLWLDWDTQ
jgi:hypothetical protein